MYKQDYLEVFINGESRVAILSGNAEEPTFTSTDPNDLSKLADVLIDLRDELIEMGVLDCE